MLRTCIAVASGVGIGIGLSRWKLPPPAPKTVEEASASATATREIEQQKINAALKMPHIFQAQDERERNFFDREQLKQHFRLLLQEDPAGIRLVVGPVSSGKTALVQACVKGNPFAVHFNLRDIKPPKTAQDLCKLLASAFQLSPEKAKATSIYDSLYQIVWDVHRTDDLQTMFNNLYRFLKASNRLLRDRGQTQLPVFFFDEFSNIKELDPEIRARFLRWLLKISKDDALCHVIVASSDGTLKDTLMLSRGAKFDVQYWKVTTMENMTEAETEVFLQGFPGQAVSDEDRKLAGGHAGTLKDLARGVSIKKVMDEEKLRYAQIQQNASSFCRFRSDCYILADYDKIMRALIASKDGAISLAEAEQLTSKRAVTALISRDYLYYHNNDVTISAARPLAQAWFEKSQGRE
eukprot:TRINITY_DN3222_c0_g2_i3.p1 TRINITY_DN3222_c0_g2~~TRINITY_DN3222_c0_g2_i3.p1  ORF type:complete len:408 (-),score=68.06 TRINITY_DN3222_c0_g2_i3:433-1656(-)